MVVKRELDFSDLQRECWSGAVDTLLTIWEHDKQDDLMDFLEGYFGDVGIPTMTEVNDLLWFEDDWIFEQIDLDPEEDEEEDDDDDEDDDEYDEDFERELSKGDDEYVERVAQEVMAKYA